MTSDRNPPYSEESERCVLGSAMMDAGRVIDALVAGGITVSDFYVPAHRRLWESILAVWRAKGKCDSMLVSVHLLSIGQLDGVGGPVFVDRLIDSTPTSAHFEHYAHIVRQMTTRRAVITACGDIGSMAYDLTLDPETVRSRAEMTFARMQDGAASADTMEATVRAILSDVEAAQSGHPPRLSVIPLGYPGLDDAIEGGVERAGMYLLKGDKKQGKTTLAANITSNVANRLVHVGVFSFEMRFRQIVEKLLNLRARTNVSRVIRGRDAVDPAALRKASELLLSHVHIVTRVSDLAQFWGHARRMVQKHGCQLLVVDYLQLLAMIGSKQRELWSRVDETSAHVMTMAHELDVPILLISQVGDDGKIRGSKQPGYDAAGEWLIWSDPDAVCDPPDYCRRVSVKVCTARYSVYGGAEHWFTLVGRTGQMIEDPIKGEPPPARRPDESSEQYGEDSGI